MKYTGAILAAGILGAGLVALHAQQPTPSGIFTLAQAEAGRVAFQNTCAKCHTATLLGRTGGPGELPPVASLSASYREFIGPRGFVSPLVGKTFVDRWGMKTSSELIARFQETVDTFPPEGMDKETTVNIVAYVLQENGALAGSRALTRTTDVVVRSVTR